MSYEEEYVKLIAKVETQYENSLKEGKHPLTFWNTSLAIAYPALFTRRFNKYEKRAFTYIERRRAETLSEIITGAQLT
ncbi:MAG TPA: hypothetical protein VJH95_04770 [Candidatus Nanoarchaeia archaeon]|nr:hypothetical protein [Candidatus Nanoarchaeia archaeon]